MTPQQQLAKVEEAITAVLIGGQEYWLEGTKVKRADLPALMKLKQQIEAEIAQASGGGVTVAVFDGR